ncbi:MAG: phosphoglucosamine mutase [Candidatus Neomarinimicrobiota bacterium]|nr:MAG: phosphoglucosamine mutase [Candidatus Neomarinimicrobiota bacterium]
MLIESLSGVRGYETDLSENVIKSYGYAFSEMMNGIKIVIGRDTRISGEKIKNTITVALNSSGASVMDLGICPTPTVQYAVEYQNASGGIVVTASHNPLPWNGLKFIGPDGLFLDAKQMNWLKNRRMEIGINLPKIKYLNSKSILYENAIKDHIDSVLRIPYLNIKKIQDKKFKVVVDAVNGAAYKAIPELLTELNCEIIPINCSCDKSFPRSPEPLPENLGELMDKVLSTGADIGFAIDPDGDRLAIVSDKGKPISEEYTLVLAEKLVLSKSTNKNKIVVTNLSTTMAVDDIARDFNARVIRTPIGEINVAKKMREVNAVIGGEGNGGVILPDAHLGRDSLVGTALVLQLLSEGDCSLSNLMKKIPKYSIIKNKLQKGKIDLNSSLPQLIKIAAADSINTDDGVKFIWENKWVHVRPSNTEPIIRIYSEAPSKIEAEKVAAPFVEFFDINS